MPHLTIEYTANLPGFDAAAALSQLNHALVESGEFGEQDIKSRAIRLDTFLVGTVPDGRGYVHVKVAILSGRTAQTKRAVSDALLAVLQQAGSWPAHIEVQLCVEIQEMERESYAKAVVAG